MDAPNTPKPDVSAPDDDDGTLGAAEAVTAEDNIEFVEEYLVKWRNRSYLHCEWVSSDVIRSEGPAGKGKLQRFLNTNPPKVDFNAAEPDKVNIIDFVDPRFVDVDRILAAKNVELEMLDGTKKTKRMYLVKWSNLNYTDATWEFEEDINDDAAIVQFFKRNTIPPRNLRRDPPHPQPSQWVKYQTSPSYRNGNVLRPYQVYMSTVNCISTLQLDGMNWLLANWYNKRNCILADEMGLGKTVQSVVLLYHLKAYQKLRGPFLVAAPLSTLEQA